MPMCSPLRQLWGADRACPREGPGGFGEERRERPGERRWQDMRLGLMVTMECVPRMSKASFSRVLLSI